MADIDIVQTHIKSVLNSQEGEHKLQQQAYHSLTSTLITQLDQQSEGNSAHQQQHLSLIKLRLDSQPGHVELKELSELLSHISVYNQEPKNAPKIEQQSIQQPPQVDTTHPDPVTAQIDPVPAPSLSMRDLPSSNKEFLALELKRKRMEEIQSTLSVHLNEVAEQNKALGKALSSERNTINNSNNLDELQALKSELSSEIAELLQGHESLAGKLENANKFMQLIESEGQDLNDELKKAHTLSLTDELTQLPNRRAFMKRIEDEVSRVQRYEYPLCFALIDLDFFKSINDRYGHNTGDEVLRSFAERALSGFRHHDLASRYGGEEFAVILPNTDIDGALRALEKVKGRTSQCTFQHNGTPHPIPTFSAGIALYNAGESPESLIGRADQALYRAKRMGRNRIETTETQDDENTSASSHHNSAQSTE